LKTALPELPDAPYGNCKSQPETTAQQDVCRHFNFLETRVAAGRHALVGRTTRKGRMVPLVPFRTHDAFAPLSRAYSAQQSAVLREFSEGTDAMVSVVGARLIVGHITGNGHMHFRSCLKSLHSSFVDH
jgi:hypothetical protein